MGETQRVDLEELGKGLGLSSLATSHKHLEKLKRKGYIVRQWNRSRQITLVEPGPTREQQLMQAFAAGYHAGETGQDVGAAWEAFKPVTDLAEEFSTTAKIVAKDA